MSESDSRGRLSVVSLVENNQRKNRKKAARAMIGKRIFFMAIRIFSANIMGGKIQVKAMKNYMFFSIFLRYKLRLVSFSVRPSFILIALP